MSYYRWCVKLHTMGKITHRAWNKTLCTKEHRGPFCVQNGQIPGKNLHLTDQYQWCPHIGNGPTFYLGSWLFMLFCICPKCAQSVLWVFICSTNVRIRIRSQHRKREVWPQIHGGNIDDLELAILVNCDTCPPLPLSDAFRIKNTPKLLF